MGFLSVLGKMRMLSTIVIGAALLRIGTLGFGRKVLTVDLDEIELNHPFRVVDGISAQQLMGVYWLQDQGPSSSLIKFPSSSSVSLNEDALWTFASSSVMSILRFADIRYTLNYTKDHTHADIYLECFHVPISSRLVSMTMTLVTENHPYQDSIVWQRNSTLFGRPFPPGIYQMVQVIDGHGRRLPSFDRYREYMKSLHSEQIHMPIP